MMEPFLLSRLGRCLELRHKNRRVEVDRLCSEQNFDFPTFLYYKSTLKKKSRVNTNTTEKNTLRFLQSQIVRFFFVTLQCVQAKRCSVSIVETSAVGLRVSEDEQLG